MDNAKRSPGFEALLALFAGGENRLPRGVGFERRDPYGGGNKTGPLAVAPAFY